MTAPRRTGRARAARFAAVSVPIGIAVTVLVSWGSALLASTQPATPAFWWFRLDGVEWWVTRDEGFGALTAECSGKFTGWDPAHPSVIDVQADVVRALDPVGPLVSRTRMLGAAKSTTAAKWRDEAHGWPFLALRHELVDPDGQPVLRGGLAVSRLDQRKKGRAIVLPLIPMWAGLAADTAIYGGGLELAWLASLGVRRTIRRRRGLCPRCGYALAGLSAPVVCPECGGTP
jgi:hypothetical protein